MEDYNFYHSKERFRTSTFLGTFYFVLMIISWLSVTLARENLVLETLIVLVSLSLSIIAFKFVRLLEQDKEAFQKPCKDCGEVITYYWFFGFYVGRHILCPNKNIIED